jgi:hypothetical protein
MRRGGLCADVAFEPEIEPDVADRRLARMPRSSAKRASPAAGASRYCALPVRDHAPACSSWPPFATPAASTRFNQQSVTCARTRTAAFDHRNESIRNAFDPPPVQPLSSGRMTSAHGEVRLPAPGNSRVALRALV